MTVVWVLLAVLFGIAGAGTALNLGVLAVGSIFYRKPPQPDTVPPVQFLILIPAYNEESVLGATLDAIAVDARPGDRVLVVADRCTDATAQLARDAGALVLERGIDEEPGRAAARQAGLAHAASLSWDAIVMIDADSRIEPGFLDACEVALASGAQALQARSEAEIGHGILAHASVAASSLQGITIPRGRDRLGLLVRLRGSGMVLRRSAIEGFEFRAAASEDLWYSLDLCLAGIRIRHVEDARLRSLNVSCWEDASNQRVRYEAGRMGAAREFVGPLLRKHDPSSLEAALFLATPPYAVAALSLVLGLVFALLSGVTVVIAVFAAMLVALILVLAVGLIQAKASLRTWLALAVAPWYLPWKAVVQVKALLSLHRGVPELSPTPRQ